ncbi:MAG: hypothetical protein AABY10_03360 [Nanoarchaeota archaeon]
MERIYILPGWFFGYSIILEFMFFLLAGIVALYAFKVYKLTYRREAKLFGGAFSFLSASYLILCLSNLFFLKISGNIREYWIEGVYQIKALFFVLYIVSLVSGLGTLVYATQKEKNNELYFIMIVVSILGVLLSSDKSFMIYFVSSLFLLFVVYHYISLYKLKGNRNTFFVMLGMVFFFVSNLLLMLVDDYFVPNLYALSHVLDILGYVFIFFSLISILQNGKKKKSP